MPDQAKTTFTIKGLLEDTETSLSGLRVYIKVGTSGYHDIGKGFRDVLVITEDGGDYSVKDTRGRVMLMTDSDAVYIRRISTNPYQKNYLIREPLNGKNRRTAVLELITKVAAKLVSFGGEKPYLELYEDILLAPAEGVEIGEAVIGDTFVIQ